MRKFRRLIWIIFLVVDDDHMCLIFVVISMHDLLLSLMRLMDAAKGASPNSSIFLWHLDFALLFCN